ncbi:MAG: selenium-dependent molybdenum cofactor biosynthesis protein YqeB [Blautia sp.]
MEAEDIATGTIQKLWNSGFGVVILETDRPTAIRRKVALSQAVYEGTAAVRRTDSRADRVSGRDRRSLEKRTDSASGRCGLQLSEKRLKPMALVDAILAKKNLGTDKTMAKHTIALGPGFTAGVDVDLVIETMRGHSLGRIIREEGMAMPNAGVPGSLPVMERNGWFTHRRKGSFIFFVSVIPWKKEALGKIGEVEVLSPLSGLLRGILPDGFPVTKGLKMADVDPRLSEYENCFTISDKARCIGGVFWKACFRL